MGVPSYLLTSPSTIQQIEHGISMTPASSTFSQTRCLSRSQSQSRSLLRHTSALSPRGAWLSAYRRGEQYTGEDVSDTWDPFTLHDPSSTDSPMIFPRSPRRVPLPLCSRSASTRSRFVPPRGLLQTQRSAGYTMKFISRVQSEGFLRSTGTDHKQGDGQRGRRTLGSDRLFGSWEADCRSSMGRYEQNRHRVRRAVYVASPFLAMVGRLDGSISKDAIMEF